MAGTIFTRFVHVVRCYQKNADGSLNTSTYCDVMVTDKFALSGINNQGFKIDVTAANAVPTITDYTGDYGNVNNGNNATRQSHILRVTNPDPNNSSEFLDVEVLDKFSISGINQQQWKGDFSSINAIVYFSAVNGPDLVPSKLQSLEETITTDSTNASRLAEVNEVAQLAQGSAYPYPLSSQPPPTTSGNFGGQFMAVEKMQEISFTTINNQEWKFNLSDALQVINDTTQYLTDKNGNLYPPQNNDPDPYIVIPSSSRGPWTGNALVSQGPLWQVINAAGGLPWGPWLVMYCSVFNPGGGPGPYYPIFANNFSITYDQQGNRIMPAQMTLLGLENWQSFPDIDQSKFSDTVTSDMKNTYAFIAPTRNPAFVLGADSWSDSYAVFNLGALKAAAPDATQFSFYTDPATVTVPIVNLATFNTKISTSWVGIFPGPPIFTGPGEWPTTSPAANLIKFYRGGGPGVQIFSSTFSLQPVLWSWFLYGAGGTPWPFPVVGGLAYAGDPWTEWDFANFAQPGRLASAVDLGNPARDGLVTIDLKTFRILTGPIGE